MAKKNVSKTKEKVTQVLGHAMESLKLLEMLEKGTLAKAKTYIKLPLGADHRKKTNDKIMQSLKRLGVATDTEVQGLRDRIEKLEKELETLRADSKEDGTSEMAGTLPQG